MPHIQMSVVDPLLNGVVSIGRGQWSTVRSMGASHKRPGGSFMHNANISDIESTFVAAAVSNYGVSLWGTFITPIASSSHPPVLVH